MKKNLLKRLVFLIILAFCAFIGKAQTNYYVSPSGDDVNNSGLIGFPKLTIQAAINVATAGDIVNVDAGIYTLTSGIVVDKSLTLQGINPLDKPLITGGDVTNKALVYVSAPDVTITNLHLQFMESNFNNSTTTSTAGYGIKTSATGTYNNLTITNNVIEGTNTAYVFNSAAIFTGVLNTNGEDKITITGNTIGHTVAGNALGRALRLHNNYGNIENNDLKGHYASIQAGDPRGGALIVNNNTMQGKLAMNGYVNPGNKITNNIITSGGTANANGATGADRQPALIEIISTTNAAASVEVSGNTLNDFKYSGVAVFGSSNVSVLNNVFNPLAASSNVINLYFDTKSTNTGAVAPQTFKNLIVKGNTFNTSTGGTDNIGIKFKNSNSNIAVEPLIGVVIGGLGAEANTFDVNLTEYINLDNTTGLTSADPLWISGFYGGTVITDIIPFKSSIDAEYNIFGTFDTRSDRIPATFLTIKTKIYDIDDVPDLGEVFLHVPVRNLSTLKGYTTIQSAIDDVFTVNGNIINVSDNTYTLTAGINITKELTLRGNNNILAAKPIIKGVGSVGTESLFIVNSPNVTIENFRIEVAQIANAKNGIRAPLSGTYNNLVIQDNDIIAMSTQYAISSTSSQFGTFGIQLGHQLNAAPQVYDEVTIKRNEIISNSANSAFGRAIRTWNTYGVIGGSLADKNVLKAYFAALQGGIFGGGITNFSYNDVTGKLSLGFFKSTGNIFSNNIITSGGTTLKATWDTTDEDAADQFPALVEVISASSPDGDVSIENNEITDYKYMGIFLMASSNVNVKNNTLTPLNGISDFTSIAVNTKTSNTNENSINSFENITITGNTFNSSDINGGRGIWFANHQGNTSTVPFTDVKVGGAGTEQNIFSANLTQYIELDNQAVADAKTIFPWYPAFKSPTNASSFYWGLNVSASTTMAYKGNVDAAYNTFGTIDSETATAFDDLVTAKAKIEDGVDNIDLGYVNIQEAKAFVSTASDLTNALATVPENFTIIVKDDVAIYGALGSAIVKKAHTFAVDNNASVNLVFTNFEADAAAKEIKFSNPAVVNGNFTLTAGKITPTTSFTIDGSQTVSVTEGVSNFINGKLIVNNLSTDLVFPVGKDSKAAYIALTGTSGTASSFDAQYFDSAYANVTDKESSINAVSNVEHWLFTSTGGSLEGKVKLYAFDPIFSSTLAASTQVISYDGTKWINQGNGANTETSFQTITADLTNSTYTAFTFGTPQPLPVNLISFDAKTITAGALISWITASEEANAKFIIEKSLDGVVFSKLTEVAAKGAGKYEFTDKNFSASAYYKLIQEDINGQVTTYNNLIRFVEGLSAGDVFAVYPNPTLSSIYVNVKTPQTEAIQLKVIDVSGKIILNLTKNSNEKSEIDFSQEKPGIYTLQLTSSDGVKYHKVIKQ